MKIAHIAPAWLRIPPKNYGGTEAVIFNLVEEQVKRGHDVTLFAPGDAETSAKLISFFPESLVESGVPWAAHMKSFFHIQKSIEYVKEHAFDIVHTHLSSASDMYVFPLIADLQLKTPVITTLHSRFPFDRVGEWIGDADGYFKEWFLHVPMVAISEQAKRNVPYPLNFIGVVHNGLSMDVFQPTVAQPDDYYVWLGRFMPEKGPHLAIQAAQRAGVPLVLAGIVDENVPAAVRYFEEQIKPHIDDQQIRYIGPVDLEQKIDLLSHARAMLNPIEWEEPFGMVMIEAMAVGCPVIAFKRGAVPEVVAQGKSGFLVSSVDEMVRMISRVNELNRVSVRAFAVQNFSVQTSAGKYMKLYERLIDPLEMLPRSVAELAKRFVLPAVQSLPTLPLSIGPTHKTSSGSSSALLEAKTSEPVQLLKPLLAQRPKEEEE